MDEWFQPGAAPKVMTRKDKQKNWKTAFFTNGTKNTTGPWIDSISVISVHIFLILISHSRNNATEIRWLIKSKLVKLNRGTLTI